ncbi:hypothetical protein WA538_002860 [Blastocystis sp. DL]
MSFLARVAPTVFRRFPATVFSRNFGVEFSLHSAADEDTYEVEADKGATILDICQSNGVEITAVCGGGGSCGSCHVILPQELFDIVEPPNDVEKELLTNVVFGVKPTSRLACRLKVNDKYAGKIIEVPMPL